MARIFLTRDYALCSFVCPARPAPHCASVASISFCPLHRQLLDRTSVAYAAIGMVRDLGFNDHVLGMGIGIFFVSYVTLQIPGALLVERRSKYPNA